MPVSEGFWQVLAGSGSLSIQFILALARDINSGFWIYDFGLPAKRFQGF
jgi:hypothetical protein